MENNNTRRPARVGRTILIAVLAVVILVLLLSSLYVVQPNEYGVVRQFGAVVDVKSEPGLYFKIPFVQEMSTLPNTVLLYDLPVSDMISADKTTLIADCFAIWRIENPRLFIETLSGSVSNAEGRINANVYNALKTVLSSMTQAEIISGRDGTPEEALAHRKMAREHDARLPPPEAREHGDHIFPRVLRVDNVDTVFRAQPGNALRRGERVRGAQVEPEHAAAESLCLFRELSAVHVGKEAAVSLRGIRPHQVFDVLFRTRLSGVADEIENVQFLNRRASRSGCRRRGSASFPRRSWTPAARQARS